MYTVTNEYETYVKSEARNYSMTGSIVNKNNVTMQITRDNILEGSLSFTNRSTANNSFDIGGCCIGSMEITLQGDYHHSLYNAVITLQQGIYVTGDTYHMEKVGTWIIKKAHWNGEWVTLECYDAMCLTQKKYTLTTGSFTPYSFFTAMCNDCGITLATTQAEIEAMVNGTATLVFNGSTQETDRKWSDLIHDMCAVICGFCSINRFGNLEVHQFGKCYKRVGNTKTYFTNQALDTLTKNDRITGGAFGNGAINITGLYINDRASKNADKSILVGNTTGTTLNLGYNRWLSSATSGYATKLQNILTQLTACQFYAADVHLADVSLYDLGDLITLQAGGELSLSEDILMCVMNIDYNFADESTISSYTFSEASDSSTSAVETNLTNRIETLESAQGGGNKIYTSTRIPTSSDTANEGDLWYQMNYTTDSAFDFPNWGYTLPLVYNPNSFQLADVRSSLELRLYDTVNDIYLYYLFLGGTNYTITYNILGPTNTFDGFDKDTGELQVTTENEQGTAWSYWNYIPRWSNRGSYLIANPLATGYSDHDMSPNIGTATYNLYSILGYADEISSGSYRLDGFRLITNGFETSWQYDKANDYNVIARWVYKENNWQVADYIAGDGVTIKNGIISANGSEIVQVSPIVTSGTQLATINGKSIYAPTTTVTQTLTEGTEIGEVNGTKLYAPSSGGSDVTVTPKTSTGTNIADIEVDDTTYHLFAPSGGGGEAIETAFIYSNEERVVGVWTDDKPLYQKTLNLTSPSQAFQGIDIADLTSLNIENLVKVEGFLYSATYGQTLPIYWSYAVNSSDIRSSNFGTVYYENGHIKQNISSTAYINCPVTITIQYTKTTDTPGSAPYITSGAYAHHYSTVEQVVGTWVDGSTLYEKTIVVSNVMIGYDSVIHTVIPHNISNFGFAISLNIACPKIGTLGDSVLIDTTTVIAVFRVNSTNIYAYSGTNHYGQSEDRVWYFTVQYTKTS